MAKSRKKTSKVDSPAPVESAPPNDAEPATGRFAYDGLDRVFHERARLGILASLVTHPQGLLFGDLKDLCTLTDGNLSRHIKVLQDAGLVDVWKSFQNNRPQTLCRLTADGRERFLEYVNVLHRVVADAADAGGSEPATTGRARLSTA